MAELVISLYCYNSIIADMTAITDKGVFFHE